jgi:hypothetical protein
MPLGPGKYDDAATVARESTQATGLILIVLHGAHGSGFSAQFDSAMMNAGALADLLRVVARELDKEGACS